MTKLTISILVHEDFSHIQSALASIIKHTTTPYKIYVVINAGDKEQCEALQRTFPDLHYIINETPQGFAANHNQIMKLANTPFIALLNDDLEVQDSALDKLVDYLENNPKTGVVAPQLEYADGSPQVTVYSDPTLFRMIYKISGLGRFTHQKSFLRRFLVLFGLARISKSASLQSYETPRAVDVLKAAAIIVRKDMVNDVGIIDETTKAFGEEIDWNLRMRQAGWNVVIVPQARIIHFGLGQAMSQLSGWQLIEDRKAILNYYLKHRPVWEAIVIRSAIVFFHGLLSILTLFYAPTQSRTHLKTVMIGLRWQRPSSDLEKVTI